MYTVAIKINIADLTTLDYFWLARVSVCNIKIR
jgi:hypothetical protein